MIMQFLNHAKRVRSISIVFPFVDIKCRIIRISEWHIASSTTNKLSLLHCCFARSVIGSISGVVQTDYVI